MSDESTGSLTQADREAAERLLRNRISARDVRHILDETFPRDARGGRKPVEWIVAETEGTSGRLHSRLPDEELVSFMVDALGPDLLTSRALRRRLVDGATPDELDRLHSYEGGQQAHGGRQSQVRAVVNRNWHPGKSWATFFASVFGFPPIFGGVAEGRSEPDSLEVDPFRPLPCLQDFQEELKAKTLEVLAGAPGANRGVLTLPTGAGKTRTAVEALLDWRATSGSDRTILWIAQSEELCEQAVQAFKEVWIDQGHRPGGSRRGLLIARLWGPHKIRLGAAVVVASIQKLHALVRDETRADEQVELNSLVGSLGAVIVDEAHRMEAPSYADVLTFLQIDLARGKTSGLPLIGLTATPFRSQEDETRALVARFHGTLIAPESLGSDPVALLRQRGVLSHPEHTVLAHTGEAIFVSSNAKFSEYYEMFKEFHPELLKQLGQDRVRNRAILQELLSIAPEKSILFFGCSVEHATAISILLRRHGRSAAVVTGTTRSATRRFLIEEFRAGRISTLCNYGVLTTGFDAPRVEVLVIARPTASAVLYEQMIGRGMRGPVFGGTERCRVIDVADNIQFNGQMAFQRYKTYWTHQASE